MARVVARTADCLHSQGIGLSGTGWMQPVTVDRLARPRVAGGHRTRLLLLGRPGRRHAAYPSRDEIALSSTRRNAHRQLRVFGPVLDCELCPERSASTGIQPQDGEFPVVAGRCCPRESSRPGRPPCWQDRRAHETLKLPQCSPDDHQYAKTQSMHVTLVHLTFEYPMMTKMPV